MNCLHPRGDLGCIWHVACKSRCFFDFDAKTLELAGQVKPSTMTKEETIAAGVAFVMNTDFGGS